MLVVGAVVAWYAWRMSGDPATHAIATATGHKRAAPPSKPSFDFYLLALTVLIHAVGWAILMRRLHRSRVLDDGRFGSRLWLLIRVAAWTVTIHCIEITVWAAFYWWKGCLSDFETSLYFAIVTYTTLGYGDVVLAEGWRVLAGVEALTGILMCGWSTGFFFAVVSRLYKSSAVTERR